MKSDNIWVHYKETTPSKMEMKKLSEVAGKCNANVAFKFITVVWKLKYTVDLKLNQPEIFSPQIEHTIVLNVISVEQLDCAQSIQNDTKFWTQIGVI